ncbi:hypothetical protein [Sulfurovum sp. NBC37-1]|uniref:hypothetical protein n=1 Tax=Sulfurovum sp. (strain NBC37-1) TaxID=387093 RepID=UPI0003240B66|nr:hypothetical protein [Sulfurovum sp. NBC37-1]
MWLKVLNLEQNLFPQLQETFGLLSSKEEKLMKILDFAEIETFVSTVQITNSPKDREEHPKGISFRAWQEPLSLNLSITFKQPEL